MAVFRQTNFLGGEFSPTLHGRTDLDRYASGLRQCKNFYISKHGAAISRPGTLFLAESGSQNTSSQVVLLPFIVDESTAYVLEFGPGYMRVYQNGAQVKLGNQPYQITTPWGTGVRSLRFAQLGNVMYLTDGLLAPQELKYTNKVNWSISPVSFSLLPYTTAGGNQPYLSDATAIQVATSTTPARDWTYMVSVVYDNALNGTTNESAPVTVTDVAQTGSPSTLFRAISVATPNKSDAANANVTTLLLVLSPDKPQKVYFRPSVPPPVATTYIPRSTRIYRGRGKVFGFVGEVVGPQETGANNSFMDYGDEPDYVLSPPTGRNPFNVYGSDGTTLIRSEAPLACGFFEGRFVYGGTDERPGRVWLSAVDSFYDFDERFLLADNHAIELELASRYRERIRHILGLDRLLVFTDASVWAVGGGDGPIKPTDLIEARVQSDTGCSTLRPVVVGSSVLYNSSKGNRVLDLTFQNERRSFVAGDITFLSRHLFDGHTLTDWTFAENPEGLIWAVRSDGKLLSLTYDRELGIAAWSLHETDGVVESVCAIPTYANEDDVYVVVRRKVQGSWRRYVERLAKRNVASVDDAVCLDSAVQVAYSTLTVSGLSHLEGKEVYAVGSGKVYGPLTVSGGSVTIAADSTPNRIVVGLRYDCDLELLDVPAARERDKVIKRVTWEVEASRGLYTGIDFASLTEWRQRTVADNYGAIPLATGEAEVRVGAGYARFGRAVLRQFDPLPLKVLGVTREGDVGG